MVRLTRSNRRAFTLVEIMIATLILVMAAAGMLRGITHAYHLQRITKERSLALMEAQSRIEDLRLADFATVLADYGSGGTWNTFDVEPHDLRAGAGAYTFYTDETLTAGDVEAARHLGLPRDLNADGDETDVDVSGDYVLLPVKVTITWKNPSKGTDGGPVLVTLDLFQILGPE